MKSITDFLEKEEMSQEEKELKSMLDLLRIKAETNVLHLYHLRKHTNKAKTSGTEGSESARTKKYENVLRELRSKFNEENEKILNSEYHSYLKSASEMVRERSSETAVTFLYLPKPPRLNSANKDDNLTKADNYLTNLEILTDHWPPTLLVRGVSPVTSTTL